MNSIEALKAVRNLLSTPKTWTVGAMARDSHNVRVSPHSQQATQFCLVGAIVRISNHNIAFETLIRDLLGNAVGNISLSLINDNDGYAAILHLLDTTITSLENPAL